MRKIIIAALLFYGFVGCKTIKQSSIFEYQGEKGTIELYNTHKKNKPLCIVIPDVYNSLIATHQVNALAKKYRVVVIYFLAHTNKTRMQQVDGLHNRTNYYSNVLTYILEEKDTIHKIIAEGINATVAINLGLNFNQPQLVLLNAWQPSMRQIITSTCYAKQSSTCDSLLSYLELTDRSAVDKLLLELEKKGTDQQYGLFTLNLWQDFIDLSPAQFLITYKSKIRWIYTSNTGLITQKNSAVEILSPKEFLQKDNLFNN